MPPDTAGQAIATAARYLAATSDTARLDAELLMAHALGVPRETLLLGRMDDPAPAAFTALVERRVGGEPIAYITGHRAFWTIELAVGPGALIPRPDSETLIEAAVDHFGKQGPAHVLDLGTGPGTLLLAALAEWPGAEGLGIDASERALDYARANARSLGLADRARFRLGDWASGVEGRFDLILCNPPYVESGAQLARDVADHEPASALYAGVDGLDDYRRIVPTLPGLITPGGLAVIEIGHDQFAALEALLAAEGLSGTIRRDLGGRDRCVVVEAGDS